MKRKELTASKMKISKKVLLRLCLYLILSFPFTTYTSTVSGGKKDGKEIEGTRGPTKTKHAPQIEKWIEENRGHATEIPTNTLSAGPFSQYDDRGGPIVIIDYFHRVLWASSFPPDAPSTLCVYVNLSIWEELQNTPPGDRRILFTPEGLSLRLSPDLLGPHHPLHSDSSWLDRYFTDHLPTLMPPEESRERKIMLERPHEQYGCWDFDPSLSKGLDWWHPGCPPSHISVAYRLFEKGLLSLEDQWIPLSWSHWFSDHSIPDELVLLHIDDHQDMMDPRLGETDHRHLFDLITGDGVNFNDPSSVKKAILSGAIGKGSIITPLAYVTKIHVRHLTYRPKYPTPQILTTQRIKDSFLLPDLSRRLHLSLKDKSPKDEASYRDTDKPEAWLKDIPPDVPIFLHVDMDYFNNRYDGNSETRTHDPPLDAQKAQMELICAQLTRSRLFERIVHTSIGISPGFYPGEFWHLTAYLMEQLEKAGIAMGAQIGSHPL